VAIAKIESLNQDAWKTINQAHLERRAFLPIVKRVASYARSMEFIYLNRLDVYTVSTYNEGTIEKLFVKPLPLAMINPEQTMKESERDELDQ
jgi:hypothetical protein